MEQQNSALPSEALDPQFLAVLQEFGLSLNNKGQVQKAVPQEAPPQTIADLARRGVDPRGSSFPPFRPENNPSDYRYDMNAPNPRPVEDAASEMRPVQRPQPYLQPAIEGAADGMFYGSGAPQVITAGQSIGQAVEDPNPTNLARAGVDVGLVPLAVAPGIGGLGSKALRAASRRGAQVVAGSVAGGAGLALGADLAEGKERKPAQPPSLADEHAAPALSALDQSVQGDPALETMAAQYKDALRRSASPVEGINPESSNAVRSEAAKEATGLLEKITGELQRRNPPKMSFEKAYPNLNQYWDWLRLAGPGAAGLLIGTKQNIAARGAMRPWENAVKDAETAINPKPGWLGKTPNPDVARATQSTAQANEFMTAHDNPSLMGKISHAAELATPTAAGASVGASMAVFPDVYNRRNAPEGSAEKKAADAKGIPETITDLARGAGLGGLEGSLMGHFAPGSKQPPVARTKALTSRADGTYQNRSTAMADSIKADRNAQNEVDLLREGTNRRGVVANEAVRDPGGPSGGPSGGSTPSPVPAPVSPGQSSGTGQNTAPVTPPAAQPQQPQIPSPTSIKPHEFQKRGKDGKWKKGFSFKPRGADTSISDLATSAMKKPAKP